MVSARSGVLIGGAACAGAAAVLFRFDPNGHLFYPSCPLFATTGIYCAACGVTRAIHALLHGRLLEALHDNALFVILTPLLLYGGAKYAWCAWRANRWPTPIDATRSLTLSVALFLTMIFFAIVRNLPSSEFDWLRPIP
jgi:hypothetical protein